LRSGNEPLKEIATYARGPKGEKRPADMIGNAVHVLPQPVKCGPYKNNRPKFQTETLSVIL
jgi:hypothetical protein